MLIFPSLVGMRRAQAIYRLLGLVYLVTIFPLVLGVGVIGGLIFMIIDVIMQLLSNDAGLSASSGEGFAGIAARLFRWPLDQLGYIFVGEPSTFPFLP